MEIESANLQVLEVIQKLRVEEFVLVQEFIKGKVNICHLIKQRVILKRTVEHLNKGQVVIPKSPLPIKIVICHLQKEDNLSIKGQRTPSLICPL